MLAAFQPPLTSHRPIPRRTCLDAELPFCLDAHAVPSVLLKGQSFQQRMDEIKHREEAEQSKQRGDDFRERKREAKRAAIESKRRQRIEREERKLMMSFFDSPSQFAGPAPPAEPIAEEEASDSGEAEEREPSFSRQLGDFNYRISNTLPAGASKV